MKLCTFSKAAICVFLATASLTVKAETSFSPAHDAVLKQFKNPKIEKTAKDAIWTKRDIFKVGVIPNGGSRDGYANYVCEVLYEHGFKGDKVWVQIIDIVKLTRTGKWEKLGEAKCL